MIVAVVAAVTYVVSYLYRRRRTLSDARIEERYSEELRIIAPAEGPSAVGFRESHGTVFEHRSEVTMATNDVNDTATTVRNLARDRARRRARIAQREANRTRGFVGAGVAAGLVVVLWALRFYLLVPMWLPIVLTVLAVVYVAGFAYLLREMSAANEADLAAIEVLTSKLKEARGARHEIRRRRAAQAGIRSSALRASASSKHVPERPRRIADEAAERPASAPANSAQVPADRRPPKSRPERERPRKAEAVATAQPASESAAIKAAAAAKPAVAKAAQSAVRARQSDAAAAGAPSYTLKRTAIERRDIAPYEAPKADVADVPYRPKAVGEKLATPTDDARGANAPTVESAQTLAGGDALDALLARRRA